MLFHIKIGLLRRLYNYTQQEMGSKLGITAQAYGKLERGETLPDLYRVQQLADIYSISCSHLTNEDLVPMILYSEQGLQITFCPRNQIPASNLLPELEDIETRLARFKSKLLLPATGG